MAFDDVSDRKVRATTPALSFFFSPSGRIGWRGYLGGIALIAFLEIAISNFRSPVLMLGASLAFAYPLFCLFAKRLHDMGAHAWPAALFVVAELAVAWLGFSFITSADPGATVAMPWEPDKLLAMRQLGVIGMLLSFVLVVGVLIALIGPRNSGPNKFGPEPAF